MEKLEERMKGLKVEELLKVIQSGLYHWHGEAAKVELEARGVWVSYGHQGEVLGWGYH
jgi:hypothetical protein